MVGALLVERVIDAAAGVIFNNVGTLHMCVHGTIGVTVTLAHLGRIGPGSYRFETLVGPVVPISRTVWSRSRTCPAGDSGPACGLVDGLGTVTGDVAWGGTGSSWPEPRHRPTGTGIGDRTALAIMNALERDAVHGGIDPRPGTRPTT